MPLEDQLKTAQKPRRGPQIMAVYPQDDAQRDAIKAAARAAGLKVSPYFLSLAMADIKRNQARTKK